MANSYANQPTKLTWEYDDYILECINPSVTVQTGFDGTLTLEARCWNVTTKMKEKETVVADYNEHYSMLTGQPWKDENMKFGIVDNSTDGSLVQEIRDLEAKKKAKKSKVKSRKDRFPKDGGKPIKASVPGYSKIPWTQGTLTLVAQSPDGQIHYAKTLQEKKDFAWANFKWILVCWPGKYTQDIFLIDDMTEFRKALGFKLRSESVVIDEDGEEWIDALFTKPLSPKPNINPSGTGIYTTYNTSAYPKF